MLDSRWLLRLVVDRANTRIGKAVMSDDFWIKLGWWLFVTSAVFFMIAAWRAGDIIALIGAVAFLAANIAFIIPIYRGRN